VPRRLESNRPGGRIKAISRSRWFALSLCFPPRPGAVFEVLRNGYMENERAADLAPCHMGAALRLVQTGLVQNYLLVAFGSVVLIFLLLKGVG
jgi:hypothetical protein